MTLTSRPLTIDQFLTLPEEEPSLEFFDGAVTQKLSLKARHSALQSALIKHIDQVAFPEKIARAFPELRTTFAGASCVPDVAIYRWERIPRDERGELVDDVFEPPDIAVEIVSLGQSVNGLIRRCTWYVSRGVQIALLVDPSDRSVVAFRPDGSITSWHGQDQIDLKEVLLDFDLTVAQLFTALR